MHHALLLASGLSSLLHPTQLITDFGTIGLLVVVFAETGLLLGFFLPGDSLLFLAGALCATTKPGLPHLSLPVVVVGVAVAALAGAQTGFLIGRWSGPRLFARPDSRFFRQEYVERAHEFLERYGYGKAIVLARFVPIVRTFMNPVAGVARVPVPVFTLWNVVGGLVWSVGVTLLGYALGSSISIDKYILPITAAIIVLSLVPIVLEARRTRQRRVAAGTVRTR